MSCPGGVTFDYGKDGGKEFAELCEFLGLREPNEVRLSGLAYVDPGGSHESECR